MDDSSSSPAALQVRGCTVRARVAVTLAVAEIAFRGLRTSDVMAQRVRRALDLAWQWEQSGDVGGTELSETVEAEIDDNFFIETDRAKGIQKDAWIVIINAIMYTSWHAHLAAGTEQHMGSMVAGVSEVSVENVVNEDAPGVDAPVLERLVRYCTEHHHAADPSALGDPIPREVMLAVAGC